MAALALAKKQIMAQDPNDPEGKNYIWQDAPDDFQGAAGPGVYTPPGTTPPPAGGPTPILPPPAPITPLPENPNGVNAEGGHTPTAADQAVIAGLPTPPPIPQPPSGPTSIIPMPPPSIAPPAGSFGPGNDLRYTTIPSGTSPAVGGLTDKIAQQAAGIGGAGTDYGAGDLRTTAITPSANAQTQSLRDVVAQGAGGLGAPLDYGPNSLRDTQVAPGGDARLTKLSDLVSGAGDKVGSAQDLTAAGMGKLAAIRQQTAEDRKTGIQDIGRGAATFGRIGSGVTTGQLGDLEALLQKRQTAAETGLASDLTLQEAADRRANATTLSGLQQAQYGQGAADRGELRTERGYQTDTALQEAGNRRAGLSLAGSLEDQLYGQDAAARGELRTERGYQTDTDLAKAASQRADLAATSGAQDQLYGQDLTGRNEQRAERGYQTGMSQQDLDNQIREMTLQDSLQTSQTNRNATNAGVELAGGQILAGQGNEAAGAGSDLLSQLSLEDYLKKLKAQQGGSAWI